MVWIAFFLSADFWNLVVDFGNHVLSSISDGAHSQGREPIWKHSSEEKTSKGVGLKDVDIEDSWVIECLRNASHKGTEESERNEAGRSNGESFSNGGGSVSSGIKLVCLVADFLSKIRHLGDSTSVVRDWSVSINRESDGEASKHSNGGKSNSIHGSPVEGKEDSGGQTEDGDDIGHVSEGESLDNVSSSIIEARLSKLNGWLVGVGGEVLG